MSTMLGGWKSNQNRLVTGEFRHYKLMQTLLFWGVWWYLSSKLTGSAVLDFNRWASLKCQYLIHNEPPWFLRIMQDIICRLKKVSFKSAGGAIILIRIMKLKVNPRYKGEWVISIWESKIGNHNWRKIEICLPV